MSKRFRRQFLSPKRCRDTFWSNFEVKNGVKTRLETILNEKSCFYRFGRRFSAILIKKSLIRSILTPQNDNLSIFIVQNVENRGLIDSEHQKTENLPFVAFVSDKIVQLPLCTCFGWPNNHITPTIDLFFRFPKEKSVYSRCNMVNWAIQTGSANPSTRGTIWLIETCFGRNLDAIE